MHRSVFLLALVLGACGPAPAPPVGPSSPVPDGSAAVAPPAHSAEELTALALQAQATGAPERNAALEQALVAWEKELGAKAAWFDATDDANPTDVMARSTLVASEDGAVLARDEGAWIAVFDGATWSKRVVLQGHRGEVRSLWLTPSGRKLFTSGADGTVRLWDAATGSAVHVERDVGAVGRMLASPDGKRLVYRCGNYLCAWGSDADAPTERKLRVRDACLTLRHWPAGDTVISGTDNEELCFLNVRSGQVEATIPFITGQLVFPASGPTFLAVVLTARAVRAEVWDASTRQRTHSLDLSGAGATSPVVPMVLPVLSADGSHAYAVTAAHVITRWDTGTGKVAGQLRSLERLSRVDALPDGRLLVGYASGQRFDVVPLDFSGIEPAFRPPRVVYTPFASAPDGRSFALGVREFAQLWSIEAGAPVRVLGPTAPDLGRVMYLRFSPDGTRLAVLHERGVRVWDVAQGTRVHDEAPPTNGRVTAAAFDAAGHLLVTVAEDVRGRAKGLQGGTLRVVDLTDPSSAPRLVPIGPHAGVQISEDGAVLVTAPPGSGLRVFDVKTGRLRTKLSIEGRWYLSPDGTMIAYVGEAKGVTGTSMHLVELAMGRTTHVADIGDPAGAVAWATGARVLVASAKSAGDVYEAVVVDPTTAQVAKRVAMPAGSPWFYASLRSDGAWLFARYRTGGMNVIRLGDGAQLSTVWVGDDGASWLGWREPGAFDLGGPHGAEFLGCRVGARVLPSALCLPRFTKPGALAEAWK